jgi:predicted PurR-regulated permease PerM
VPSIACVKPVPPPAAAPTTVEVVLTPEPPRRIAVTSVSPRAVLTVIALAVAVAAGLWILWQTRRIATWVIIAAFLAVALNPVVDALQKWLRLKRVLAISLTFLLGIILAAGVLLLLVPPLIDAGQQLADDAPGYVDRLGETRIVQELDTRYDVIDRMKEFVNDLPDKFGGAGAAVSVAQSLLSGLLGGLTVLVLTFLFLIYGRQMRDQCVGLLRANQKQRYHRLLDDMYKSVGGYVAGNLLVSIIAGVTAYITLTIFGVPAAAALAFWVAIADLVPLVGATVGAIPGVAVAFFSGWPVGVGVAIYFLLYQQVENHFVQPMVMRRTTNLNPLVVLIAVLVGASLLGILGALLAIPAASIAKIFLQDWWAHRHPTEAETQTEPLAPGDPPDGPEIAITA